MKLWQAIIIVVVLLPFILNPILRALNRYLDRRGR